MFDAGDLGLDCALRGICLAGLALNSLLPGQPPYFDRLSMIAEMLGVVLPTADRRY
jgi:hypothetical protein